MTDQSSSSANSDVSEPFDAQAPSAPHLPSDAPFTPATLTLRKLTIGSGRPKVIVPITGKTADDVQRSAATIAQSDAADLAEFRIDYVKGPTADDIAQLCGQVRAILGDKPLLVTFRTKDEGGEQAISETDYEHVYGVILNTQPPDLIDIQMMMDVSRVRRLVKLAHARGTAVVMSNHNFHETPPEDVLIARLRLQQSLGADILKIAAMPKHPGDTIQLMQATWKMYSIYAERPLLTMSMGSTGLVSRVSGQLTGSSLSYGSIGSASAPGQLDAEDLQKVLSIIASSSS